VRAALWLVLLAAAAVAIALLGRHSNGLVIIVLAPWRVELSLNLLVLMVFAGYFAFYFLARLVATLLAIPARVKAYREARVRDRSRQSLNDALVAFFQGRYATAERAASQALGMDESKGVAAIIAAKSAHELGRFTEREAFLEKANTTGRPEIDLLRLTTLADLLLGQSKHEEALAVLKELTQKDAKNVRLLRMRLQAEQALRRWDEVLATLAMLGRLDAMGQGERDALTRAAHLGNLNRKALDAPALAAYWKQMPSDLRLDAVLAATAARYFLAAGGSEEAQAILELALEHEWSAALVAIYGEAHGTTAMPQIERAERWLREHPRDPALLLTLGKLCMKQGLWGKAQSYIEASLAMEPTQDGHMTLAALMERIGKPNEAVRHFRRSAELAG
jgi:HemY protein